MERTDGPRPPRGRGRGRGHRTVPASALSRGLVLGLALSASALGATGVSGSRSPHSVYEDFFARPAHQVFFGKTLLRESSLPQNNPALVVLAAPSGGRWACRIPAPEEEGDAPAPPKIDPEVERLEAVRRLEPLRNGCLYYLQGWFSYAYCQWVERMGGEGAIHRLDIILSTTD